MRIGTDWGRSWWDKHLSLYSHRLLQEWGLRGAFRSLARPGREERKQGLVGQPVVPAWGVVPSCR